MRLMAAAVGVIAVCSASIADAAPVRKRVTVVAVRPAPVTYVMHRDESGRTRTKILVQKRSYLDGGTEVMPGDNVDAYRSSFLLHRATSGLGQNDVFNPRGPIPDPFFLPGKNNPYPGFMY